MKLTFVCYFVCCVQAHRSLSRNCYSVLCEAGEGEENVPNCTGDTNRPFPVKLQKRTLKMNRRPFSEL